jgi:LmbE family N-acetylglucosaminyl deacetylase
MPQTESIRQAWAALPWADQTNFRLGRRPLILAPHPDDETLGCGGLIAACCSVGQPPIVAVLTDGAASHPGLDLSGRNQLRRQREREVGQAVSCLGLPPANLKLLGLPDGALDSAAAPCTEVLIHLARTHGCDMIVTTSHHDRHSDHQAAARIAVDVASAVSIPCRFYLTWAWIVPSGIEAPVTGVQGWRLDISPYLAAKRRAIVAHESQYYGMPDDPAQGCLPAELLAIAQRGFEVILAA